MTQAFIDYWTAVDVELKKFYCITTADAGIEPSELADAQDAGTTPEAYALWFGEKHALIRRDPPL